ncbi:hypothetical protein Gogos_019942 [Gossypium gossypioides]|uniref:Uncharacterized protein n=1 Tax=Gossypium gossypioides TaxID=34282 RepID=A0A7J9D360_GOSGO|nr:hypothetical protein [Gossypium gossypioides]
MESSLDDPMRFCTDAETSTGSLCLEFKKLSDMLLYSF